MNDSRQSAGSRDGAWLVLACAVAMQACLGATYAWSVFAAPLKATCGIGQGTVQLPFTLFYIVFPATALFAGPVMSRIGPRASAIAGGLLFGCGWAVASLGSHGFGLTVAGIGVLGAVGVGFAYVVPIAVCVSWFPMHKGLVTGIAVAGFGGGAAAVSQAAHYLMETCGMTPFGAFRLLGVVFAAIVGLAGLAMRHPPQTAMPAMPAAAQSPGDEPETELATASTHVSFGETVRDPGFRILYAAMCCGLVAGLTVNANLKQLSPSATAHAGVWAVSLFALANAMGRVTWGWVFDRVRRPASVIRANLLAQGLLMLASPWLVRSGATLQLLALGVGFNYGGVLVLYAATVAGHWGSHRVGHIYGWLFSSNIVAALAPTLAGHARDALGSFTAPLLVVALLQLAAMAPLGRLGRTHAHISRRQAD